jgi:hypothetical protein
MPVTLSKTYSLPTYKRHNINLISVIILILLLVTREETLLLIITVTRFPRLVIVDDFTYEVALNL